MKSLVIAEKPSVGKAIAAVIGVTEQHNGYMESNNYVVSWAHGHLIELKEPKDLDPKWEKWELNTLPIIPEKMKYQVSKSGAGQYKILKELIHREDVGEIINAGDDGREGEYIQRLIYDMARNDKPVKRLCIDSNSVKTITKAFQNLKPGDVYNGFYAAAKGRAWSDYILGLSFSRLVCLTYNAYGLSIGRVQTPTLGIVKQRDEDIANFVSTPFYEISAVFSNGSSEVVTTWFDENGTRIDTKDKAEQIITSIEGQPGNVSSLEVTKKSTNRPQLYSLNGLQRDAIKAFGYTSEDVLNIAQSLYEKHKITTYPRTESSHLTSDLQEEYLELLVDVGSYSSNHFDAAKEVLENPLMDKNIVDDSKVTDHHAIIINENFKTYDLSKLNEEERNVLTLILNRMILAAAQKYVFNETALTITVCDQNFKATGKQPLEQGWFHIAQILGCKKSDEDQGQTFDGYKQKTSVMNIRNEILSKKTSPPKPFTEESLLGVMENISRLFDDKKSKDAVSRGLGTTATRSTIISELFGKEYLAREKKGKNPPIHATEKGIKLINIAPKELVTPILTAEWEIQLQEIEKGTGNLDEFMDGIKSYVRQVTNDYLNMDKSKIQEIHFDSGFEKTIIGKCPLCGGDVIKGKMNYYCSNYNEKECHFTLWFNDKKFSSYGKTITDSIAKDLLTSGKTFVKGLKKEEGNKFDAYIQIEQWGDGVTNKYNQWKKGFEFKQKKPSSKGRKPSGSRFSH